MKDQEDNHLKEEETTERDHHEPKKLINGTLTRLRKERGMKESTNIFLENGKRATIYMNFLSRNYFLLMIA